MKLSIIKYILKKPKASRFQTLRDDKIDPNSMNWTRWFFPWWYLESVYRRMYPNYKPSLKELERFDKRYRQTTVFYWLGLWTFFGIFITRQWSLYIADELPPQETDEEKHARLIMKSARYSGGDMTEKAKRSKSYVLEGFTLREIDISQELEKQQQREREELEASGNMSKYATKYEDPEWVAQRAGMKQDDPKFDFNFLSGYFKRVDYRARGTDNLWEKTTNPHKKSNDPDIDIEALKERNLKLKQLQEEN